MELIEWSFYELPNIQELDFSGTKIIEIKYSFNKPTALNKLVLPDKIEPSARETFERLERLVQANISASQ